MVGKRVQFDDETWAAIDMLARESRRYFQDLAEEAFGTCSPNTVGRLGLKISSKAV